MATPCAMAEEWPIEPTVRKSRACLQQQQDKTDSET
jgi:hypothetical protein